ncbi:hypothetical protein [Streptomyces soliscabiei]|uniref:hypothetical protein n=1 Tax=Streptomyces soliscabiei TaxID=588897 RepID=UPI0029A5C84A|nr:hypothetical protein [Streptomyces sp. NY05-11A]MDX2683212.1 hypothetical protein [Streptomyces sp. NY05-11A]
MTTYHSDGRSVATGEPLLDARTEAADQDELLEELWVALTPKLRVAVAVFEPGRLADAAIRHEVSA